MENPTDKDRLLLKHQRLARCFRCEDTNVAFTNVQPHYYRVRQVEPCHHSGWSNQALILSILALGAMPKQQQPLLLETIKTKYDNVQQEATWRHDGVG